MPLTPAIEPVVSNGQLAAMMEVYAPKLAPETLQATLDIVTDENAKPLLISADDDWQRRRSPEVGVLQGVLNTTALPPGRYLARASVAGSGKAQGHLVRPFRVTPRPRSRRTTRRMSRMSRQAASGAA